MTDSFILTQTRIKALVVEDSAPFREWMAERLESTGIFVADTADSVHAGAEKMRYSKYDLLSADFKFDGKNTGYLLFTPALDSNPDMTIVVVSKYAVRNEVLSIGAHGFVSKSQCEASGSECITAITKVLASRLVRQVTRHLTNVEALHRFLRLTSPQPRSTWSGQIADEVGTIHKLSLLDPDLYKLRALRHRLIAKRMMEPGTHFILAYVASEGRIPMRRLQMNLGCSPSHLALELDFLQASGLLDIKDELVETTPAGQFFLKAMGM